MKSNNFKFSNYTIAIGLLFTSSTIIKPDFSDVKIFEYSNKFDKWTCPNGNYHDPYKNGEYNVSFQLIQDGYTFFDVGASFGAYTNTVAKKFKNLKIFTFEPVPLVFTFLEKNVKQFRLSEYPTLLKNWYIYLKELNSKENNTNNTVSSETDIIDRNNNAINLINKALSSTTGKVNFNFDPKRPSVGGIEQLDKSYKVVVERETIDSFCQKHNIEKINYLKIDTEGHDFHVVKGAEEMLQNQSIDFIQFEYIARCKKAHWNLEKMYYYLKNLNYTLFKIVSDGIILIDKWRPSLENYIYANFLAISNTIYINKKKS